MTQQLNKNNGNQSDYLTNADQMIPDGLVQYSISERGKSVIKSQFGDTGLTINDSIWGLFFLIVLLNKGEVRKSGNLVAP